MYHVHICLPLTRWGKWVPSWETYSLKEQHVWATRHVSSSIKLWWQYKTSFQPDGIFPYALKFSRVFMRHLWNDYHFILAQIISKLKLPPEVTQNWNRTSKSRRLCDTSFLYKNLRLPVHLETDLLPNFAFIITPLRDLISIAKETTTTFDSCLSNQVLAYQSSGIFGNNFRIPSCMMYFCFYFWKG